MKRYFIYVMLIIALSGCYTEVRKSESICESEKLKYEQIFTDLRNYLEKENGKLWNHQLYGSLMLVNYDTRVIIANVCDNSGVLEKNGSVYTGILPDEINIANTAFDWNGKRWTMVVLPLPDDKFERQNLLAHELFHRIQPEIGFNNFKMETCDHLDTRDGRIYLKLELEALKKALESNNNEQEKEHIRNALLFRKYRYSIFPEAKEKENLLEINEGIAEYTGSILSGRCDSLLRKHYIDYIELLMENPTFVSSFAYRTIPVYGYFMKKDDENWNLKISSETNLADFISDFYSFTLAESIKNQFEDVRTDYNYQQINYQENEREEKQKALLEILDDKFKNNPVLVIPLQNMSISYNPGTLIPYREIGTVYPTLRITDDWGILTVEKGALVTKNWKSVIITEPVNTIDTISGNGWKLTLNKGWEISETDGNFILAKKEHNETER